MEENGIITIQEPAIIMHGIHGIDAVIDSFILSLNAQKTTKSTYRKAMMLFAGWVGETGQCDFNTLARVDILAYKEHLLKS